MIRYSVPLIVSLLVAALYNIVDQIFIANASYLGSNGNAANNVVFPMTVIALAFTLMIGDGVCAFVSMSLGARNHKQAGDSVGSAALLSSSVGVIIALVYWVFREELVTIFGGRVNDETFRLAVEYFSWIIPGIPFYVFGQAMNPVISADGSPNYVMFSTLMGAGINIVLDPLFIFGFHKNKILKTKSVYLQSMGNADYDKKFYEALRKGMNALYGKTQETPTANTRAAGKIMLKNVWTPDKYTTITLTYNSEMSKRFPGSSLTSKFIQLIYKYDKWDD